MTAVPDKPEVVPGRHEIAPRRPKIVPDRPQLVPQCVVTSAARIAEVVRMYERSCICVRYTYPPKMSDVWSWTLYLTLKT